MRAFAFAAALVALVLSGCATLTPELSDTQRMMQRVVPARAIDHRIAVGAGPMTMGLARRILLLASDDPDARRAANLLRHVKTARVRVYTLRAGTTVHPERLTLPRSLARRGWTPFVRVRDEGTAVWVLAREQHGRITGLYTLALTEDAFIVAQVSGRFDQLIQERPRPRRRLDAALRPQRLRPGRARQRGAIRRRAPPKRQRPYPPAPPSSRSAASSRVWMPPKAPLLMMSTTSPGRTASTSAGRSVSALG